MSNVATIGLSNPVGLREWRANLSAYVEAVAHGHSFTVMQRGRAVARLVPVPAASAYERLVQDGTITPASRRAPAFEPPVAARGSVSDLVAQQRR